MGKKSNLEIQFATINAEFKIIKQLIYIIFAALLGLLVKAYWSFILNLPAITGNAIKTIFS